MAKEETNKNPSRFKEFLIEIIESFIVKKLNDIVSNQDKISVRIIGKIQNHATVLRSIKKECQDQKEQINDLSDLLKDYKKISDRIEEKVKVQNNSIGSLTEENDKTNINIKNLSNSIEGKIQSETNAIDSLIREYEKLNNKILSISNEIDNQNKTFTNSIDSLKDECKKTNNLILSNRQHNNSTAMKKRDLKWIISISAIATITVFVIIMLVVQANNFVNDLNQIDAGIINKVKDESLLETGNVKNEINIQFSKYATHDQITKKDLERLKNDLILEVESLNDSTINGSLNNITINEIEKEKNQLIKNVTIINLVGRYTVILCCIIAFVMVFRAFAGSKSKEDIFE